MDYDSDSSDEEIFWGPVTLKEVKIHLKRIPRKITRRHSDSDFLVGLGYLEESVKQRKQLGSNSNSAEDNYSLTSERSSVESFDKSNKINNNLNEDKEQNKLPKLKINDRTFNETYSMGVTDETLVFKQNYSFHDEAKQLPITLNIPETSLSSHPSDHIMKEGAEEFQSEFLKDLTGDYDDLYCLNDTIEEMEKALEELSLSQNFLTPIQNSTSLTMKACPETPKKKPVIITLTSKLQTPSLQRSDSKTSQNTVQSVTFDKNKSKQNSTKNKKFRYDYVKSSVGKYIHKTTSTVQSKIETQLMLKTPQRIHKTPQRIPKTPKTDSVSYVKLYINNPTLAIHRHVKVDTKSPRITGSSIENRKNDMDHTLQPVIYKPAKQLYLNENKINLPQKIKKLIPETNVIIHEKRIKKNLDECVLENKLLENDLTHVMDLNNDSIDMSILNSKQVFIK